MINKKVHETLKTCTKVSDHTNFSCLEHPARVTPSTESKFGNGRGSYLICATHHEMNTDRPKLAWGRGGTSPRIPVREPNDRRDSRLNVSALTTLAANRAWSARRRQADSNRITRPLCTEGPFHLKARKPWPIHRCARIVAIGHTPYLLGGGHCRVIMGFKPRIQHPL